MRRHKIDILKPPTGRDGYGEPLDEWTAFKSNIWASKEDVIGKEFYSALTTENKVEKKFTTQYFNDISSEMRIKHGNDIYEIIGRPVNIGDRNIELLIYCRLVK
nr:phage head closure protein [Sedimentibacter sp.]